MTQPEKAAATHTVVHSNRLGNGLVKVREALLNRMSGVTPTLVVNDMIAELPAPPADLVVQIKRALTQIKITAMEADGTRVNYTAMRDDPIYLAYRQTHLAALRQFNPSCLPLPAARAFWINLYNSLVIDAVLAFNIKSSVIEGAIGLLTFFRRAAYLVGGQRVSLEDMEHGILRGNRGNPYIPGVHFAADAPRLLWALPADPRIHFALNCGGRSCPPIRVYEPEQLERQLDLATRSYLDLAVKAAPDRNTLVLPQILRWFVADYGGQDGLRQFLSDYLPNGRRRTLLTFSETKITFAPYDWRLNLS